MGPARQLLFMTFDWTPRSAARAAGPSGVARTFGCGGAPLPAAYWASELALLLQAFANGLTFDSGTPAASRTAPRSI